MAKPPADYPRLLGDDKYVRVLEWGIYGRQDFTDQCLQRHPGPREESLVDRVN